MLRNSEGELGWVRPGPIIVPIVLPIRIVLFPIIVPIIAVLAPIVAPGFVIYVMDVCCLARSGIRFQMAPV